MTLFIAAAAVIALASLVLLFAPVLREQRAAGFALVLLGLVSTAGLYMTIGTPDALDPERRKTPDTLAGAVLRLEKEMRRDPSQVEGWRLLADAYKAQGRNADAATAYARAVELQPRNPDVLAQAAEARALASPERRFDDQAMDLLRRALQMDPGHQRANWFLGVAQRQAGQPAEAAATWERLLADVDAATGTALRVQIQSARADAGLPPLPEGEAATPQAGPARSVTVKVDVDATLRGRLPPATPVFVIARVPGGPPMPVAVERLTLADLPAEVVLDDADSPMPTQKLSSLPRVEVLARASASGSANAGSGDLESQPRAVAIGGSTSVRIERVRP